MGVCFPDQLMMRKASTLAEAKATVTLSTRASSYIIDEKVTIWHSEGNSLSLVQSAYMNLEQA